MRFEPKDMELKYRWLTTLKDKIDGLFKNVKSLPTLPPVVQKVLAPINDPKVGAKQLAEAVETHLEILYITEYFGV